MEKKEGNLIIWLRDDEEVVLTVNGEPVKLVVLPKSGTRTRLLFRADKERVRIERRPKP